MNIYSHLPEKLVEKSGYSRRLCPCLSVRRARWPTPKVQAVHQKSTSPNVVSICAANCYTSQNQNKNKSSEPSLFKYQITYYFGSLDEDLVSKREKKTSLAIRNSENGEVFSVQSVSVSVMKCSVAQGNSSGPVLARIASTP